MGTHPRHDIDEYVFKVIRIKSKQLIGKYGFTVSDRDEIQQDVLSDVLKGLPHFDPARAQRTTFISMLISRSIAGQIRRRRQPGRDYRRCSESLDRVVGNDGATVLDQVDPGTDDRHNRDLKSDFARAWQSLSPELQELLKDAGEESVADISRRTGRTRSAIRHAIARAKRHLASCGLEIYLPAAKPSRRGIDIPSSSH